MEMEKIKMYTQIIEDLNPENYDIIESIMNNSFRDLSEKLDNLIIKALKLKGFEFDNKIELNQFVKNNCRCEDNVDFKERTYYVHDKPFFLHKYKTEVSASPSISVGPLTICCTIGSFYNL